MLFGALVAFVAGLAATTAAVSGLALALGTAGARSAIARPWEALGMASRNAASASAVAGVAVLPPNAPLPRLEAPGPASAALSALALAWSALVGADPPSPAPPPPADRRLPLPGMPPMSPAEARVQARARLEAVVTLDLRTGAPGAIGSAVFGRAVEADMEAGLLPAGGSLSLTTARSPFHPLAATARRGDTSRWVAVGAMSGALPSALRVGVLYLLGHAETWGVAAGSGGGGGGGAAKAGALPGGGLTPAELAAGWGGGHTAADARAETLVQALAMRPAPEAVVPACAAQASSRLSPAEVVDAAAASAGGRDGGSSALQRAAAHAAEAAAPDALYAECGFALWFPVDTRAARDAVVLAARLLGRPSVLRWSPDAWPGSAVASVVPTSAAASAMAETAPAARLPHRATAAAPLGPALGTVATPRGPGEFLDERGHAVVDRRTEL